MKKPFAEFVKTELDSRILLITCGLPGTWKTETAAEIAKIKGYPILRSDLIRLEVLKNEDIFNPKIASNMRKRMSVYDEMFRQAEEAVKKNQEGLILDATFITQELRNCAARIAAENNLIFVILETRCPEDVSISRILRRTKENYESNALTVEAYRNNKNRFEAVDINAFKELYPNLSIIHLIVDTEFDPADEWFVVGNEKIE